MPCPRTQQANLPACSLQPPIDAERQAGKLRMPFFKVFWYDSTRGMNPRSADCVADALTTTPSRRSKQSCCLGVSSPPPPQKNVVVVGANINLNPKNLFESKRRCRMQFRVLIDQPLDFLLQFFLSSNLSFSWFFLQCRTKSLQPCAFTCSYFDSVKILNVFRHSFRL